MESQMKLSKSFLTEQNIDTLKINIDALSSKKFKYINIFVKQDDTFINLGINPNQQFKIETSDNDIQISGDNFKFEINPETINNFNEDTDIVLIETNVLKITFKK